MSRPKFGADFQEVTTPPRQLDMMQPELFDDPAPPCRCGHPLHAGQCPNADGCWCDSFSEEG